MRELILVRGASGSGKTTYAKMMSGIISANQQAYAFDISADDYFTETDVNGIEEYNFDPTKLKEAHAECLEAARSIMKTYNHDVFLFVHNTFTQTWEMDPYLKLAEECDYKVTSLVIEHRHTNKSIHNVPEESIKKQKERFDIKL